MQESAADARDCRGYRKLAQMPHTGAHDNGAPGTAAVPGNRYTEQCRGYRKVPRMPETGAHAGNYRRCHTQPRTITAAPEPLQFLATAAPNIGADAGKCRGCRRGAA
ncbi:hypothetical protein GCM10025863_20370 [Microbacterium suwonense]|uniref:Uncharacterized protein n=1 Tax=Microbacterium suwonense TaxID=683047 RepID=A0ABN6X5V2_9MICO|nr:hypothetical protein GCM10025863_20370 [Microbacterium suwonense]